MKLRFNQDPIDYLLRVERCPHYEILAPVHKKAAFYEASPREPSSPYAINRPD